MTLEELLRTAKFLGLDKAMVQAIQTKIAEANKTPPAGANVANLRPAIQSAQARANLRPPVGRFKPPKPGLIYPNRLGRATPPPTVPTPPASLGGVPPTLPTPTIPTPQIGQGVLPGEMNQLRLGDYPQLRTPNPFVNKNMEVPAPPTSLGGKAPPVPRIGRR